MGETRYILAGSLIDGSGTDVRRNIYLAVNDGIIVEVGPAENLPSSNQALIDDLSHCVILPPLVDCSISLSSSSSIDKPVQIPIEETSLEKKKTSLTRHIHYCHLHGVMGVADSGDFSDLLKSHQNDTVQEQPLDIRTSGRPCQSIEDFADRKTADLDYFKIAYSENIGDDDGPDLQISSESLNHVLQEKGGKKVVVIANGEKQVQEALAAGCDAIEQGYGMGEENLKKMAEMNVLWIPSVIRAKNGLDGASAGGSVCCRFSQRYVAPGKPIPGAEAFWKKVLAEQLHQLRLAKKVGVRVAVGTGAGSIGILHGESMVEEMKLFIKAGYSLAETVHFASAVGARFFNLQNSGTLSVNRKATFLITRGTPQQLPRKLAYLEGIYVEGELSSSYSKNPTRTA